MQLELTAMCSASVCQWIITTINGHMWGSTATISLLIFTRRKWSWVMRQTGFTIGAKEVISLNLHLRRWTQMIAWKANSMSLWYTNMVWTSSIASTWSRYVRRCEDWVCRWTSWPYFPPTFALGRKQELPDHMHTSGTWHIAPMDQWGSLQNAEISMVRNQMRITSLLICCTHLHTGLI